MKTPAQFIAENIRGQDFEVGRLALTGPIYGAVFSFLYFFKIKISKIYVRFEIF